MVVLEDADYFIRYIELPMTVGGFVTTNDDGTYSMYINQNHDPETQLEDYIHEYKHILFQDLHGVKNIRDIET